jgi:hypothetical protein
VSTRRVARHPRHRRALLAALVPLTLLAGAACSTGPSEATVAHRQFQHLMTQPDAEEAVQQYTRLYTRMRQQLSQTFPHLGPWELTLESDYSGCSSSYPELDLEDGREDSLPNYAASGVLTESEWDQAVDMVGTLVAPYGFDRHPQVLNDRAGVHDVVFHGPNEAQIGFDTLTDSGTGLTFEVGCHLTPQAKQRGHPDGAPNP